jgi:hypothetical protein
MNYCTNIYNNKDRPHIGQPDFLHWMSDKEDKHFVVEANKGETIEAKPKCGIVSVFNVDNGVVQVDIRDVRTFICGLVVGYIIFRILSR